MDKYKDWFFRYNGELNRWAAFKEKDRSKYESKNRAMQTGIIYGDKVGDLIEYIDEFDNKSKEIEVKFKTI